MAEKKKSKTLVVPKNEDKLKALKTTIEGIEKNYGAGAIMKLGEDSKIKIGTIPSGCLELDSALGIGGYPKGRIVEIYGPESSGKTTLALHAIAEAQKQGGVAAFIDAEHALDPVYAKSLGVNIDELYVSQPDNGEQALDICEALILSGAIDLVVVDSVAALVPKDEIDGTMGENVVGMHARLMSKAMRKLTGYVARSNTCAIFINQLRQKIGVIYGSPEVTTGGMALKFYASVRIDIRRGEAIKEGTEVLGNRTKVKIVKNKLAPPFRLAEFDIMYGKGISAEGCVLDMAATRGFIKKSGSWYSYEEERIGQGRENAKKFLLDNPEIYAQLEEKIRATFLGGEADAEKLKAEAKATKKPAKDDLEIDMGMDDIADIMDLDDDDEI